MHERIYVCHTFYHVYIACLKELLLRHNADVGKASLVLSLMSNDFSGLKDRISGSGLFAEVIEYDEKHYDFFPELKKYKEDGKNIIKNMLNRIAFCRKYAILQKDFVPVDFKKYKEVYVFCDSDPVGYYLNYYKIPYHALEDGLDCLKYYDSARYDNRGHFNIKAWFAKTGLIFIQNGWAKYCVDMEVNDISAIKYPCPKYKELRRAALVKELKGEDKEILLKIFIENYDELSLLEKRIKETKSSCVLILTEPLCDKDTRKRLFSDMVREYGAINGKKAEIIIKRHPRDILKYTEFFPDAIVLDSPFPMEILNLMNGIRFDRIVSVYTVLDSFDDSAEKIYLGNDFMDKYEDPSLHRKNEII